MVGKSAVNREVEKNGDKDRIRLLTIPNLLSISRLVILPLVLFFILRREAVAAVIVMFISWFTDALDGYLARRLKQVTNTGRVLDHLVDKIWVGSVLITLVFMSDLPLVIAGAVLVRDLLILAGSAVVMKVKGSFVSSDVVGKITGCAFALLILLYTLSGDRGNSCLSPFLFQLNSFKVFADYTVLVLIVVSFINYLVIFLRIMIKFRLPGEEN
ncbi:MAG: CDP-alcohol phosphatidyltransferase family protein [bacterium]